MKNNQNIKIALVGEAPNDTQSIKNLMEKKYSLGYDFFFMLDRINGSKLDSQKTKRFLRNEYETKNPDIVIFIRDLDSILPNKVKQTERQQYFTNSNSVVDKKGIYLLHIYEIEALILADISIFNTIYNCNIPPIDDPMKMEEPKEYLQKQANNYSESNNATIFEEIRFEKALECAYFSTFITKFDKLRESLNNK